MISTLVSGRLAGAIGGRSDLRVRCRLLGILPNRCSSELTLFSSGQMTRNEDFPLRNTWQNTSYSCSLCAAKCHVRTPCPTLDFGTMPIASIHQSDIGLALVAKRAVAASHSSAKAPLPRDWLTRLAQAHVDRFVDLQLDIVLGISNASIPQEEHVTADRMVRQEEHVTADRMCANYPMGGRVAGRHCLPPPKSLCEK